MIIEKVIGLNNIFNELDNSKDVLLETLSVDDKKISDLYHYLENMNLDSKKCYRFCKELKSVLGDRRTAKKNLSIFQYYETNKHKLLSGNGNREIFMNGLYRTNKAWENPYNNDIYTEEELKEIMEG